MPITVTCGSCGSMLRAPDTAAGRKVKCSKCGDAIAVPAGDELQEMAPAPVRARPPMPARGQAPTRVGGSAGDESFTFDGGAADFLGTGILAYLLTAFTLGIGFPWAICLIQRWQKYHTMIGDRRLKFVGTGGELFGKWIIWALLTVVTFGIYSLWVTPALQRWMTEKTEFDNG